MELNSLTNSKSNIRSHLNIIENDTKELNTNLSIPKVLNTREQPDILRMLDTEIIKHESQIQELQPFESGDD